VVLGSPRLVQTLLGGDKRIFPDDGARRALDLVSTVTAATGVIVSTNRPVKPPTRIHVRSSSRQPDDPYRQRDRRSFPPVRKQHE